MAEQDLDDVVISVKNVSKEFKLPHEKVGSVKNIFTNFAHTISASRTFTRQKALKDISFEIKRGEFFGVVGRNGSGKSTMLKILAGIYQPTSGQVETNGRLVPFIELGVGFNPELTGRDNVYLNGALLGFSKKEIDAQYNQIVAFAELEEFMDQKLKNYSSGMQVRLAFSMAIRADADLLLIDEVLAVGDADFQRKCYEYFKKLKSNNKTVIFISHDMQAIREYCDRAILIEKGVIIEEESVTSVSNAYTQLFMKQDVSAKKKAGGKRWGSGEAIYKKPVIEATAEKIKFSSTIVVKKPVPSLVLGFTVIGGDEVKVMGTNTQIKQQAIRGAKAGDTYKIEWEFPNILEDGNYNIALTAHAPSGLPVYDWWEDALQIGIRKPERTGYKVNPNIKVNLAKD